MQLLEGSMSERDLAEWRRGADAAAAAIHAARRAGDWEALDLLAIALGIGDGPADRGAWEAICEALSTPPLR